MPPVTRSQSSRRPSSQSPRPPTSPSPPPQPMQPRRRRCRSSIDSNKNNSKNETASTDKHQTGQAIQLNLPLALPPPFNRQLLSLCFHSSWRTRRRLRIHFSNRSEVLLDDGSSSGSDSAESDNDSDPDSEHHHASLTVISYDPIAVPLRAAARRRLVPAIVASLVVAAAVILAAALTYFRLHPSPRPPLPPPRPRPITLRNLTAVVQPYARLVRLLDNKSPTTPLPAITREFSELCTLAGALAARGVVPEPCHDIVDLLDTASVHLSSLLVGIRTRPGPGNPISALRDTLLLMAWGIDKQKQQQQDQDEDQGQKPRGNADGGGAWNMTAEGIFRAVASQVPNWWDDHNALAAPLQTALTSLREARRLEGDVLAAFKRAIGGADLNDFPSEDVSYAHDRLFDPLLPRRDTLLHTLESATGLLDDAAGRMYEFNATLHETRGEARAPGGRRRYAFEDFDVLLGRVKDALGILDHELEAVGVRERQRRRDGVGEEEEAAAARKVEEKRPRRRREREDERQRRPWWKRSGYL